MVKLPTIQSRGSVTRGAQSSVSASEIANPFQQIASAFDATGDFLEKKSTDDARIEGQDAIYKDDQGNLKVDLKSNWSERDRTYNRYAMQTFAAQSEIEIKGAMTRLQQDAKGNPDTFSAGAKAFRDNYLTKTPAQLRGPVRSMLDAQVEMGRAGVMDQKHRSDMAVTKSTLLSSIEMKQDEMAALAFQGGTGTDAYKQRQAEVKTIWGELSDPIFQIGQEEADMRMKQMEGRHTGEAILGQAERALQAGDYNKVAEMRQSILTDTKIALSPQERRQYAGMISDRQSNFTAQRKVVRDALIDRGSERKKMWEEGASLDDPEDDDLISELKKQDLASGRALERQRTLQRDLANYRRLGNADQVAALERNIANENRPAPGRSRPVSVAPELSGRMQQAMNHYISRGLSPVMAAGIVGNLVQESSLNTSALNPGDGRDGSNSIGIGQWNGTRAQALKKFAADRGASPEDFSTQLDFVVHELETTEGVSYQRLRAARNVDEAAAAMIGFERPAGWSDANPRAGHGWGNRLSMAIKAGELQGLNGDALAVTQGASVPPELIKEYRQEVASDLKSDLSRWSIEISKGNIPDANSLGLLQRQLALIDDQNLRSEYQSIFRQSEAFMGGYRENPSVAAEFLNSLEATTGSEGATLAQADIIDAFKKGDAARRSALTNDPHGYGSRAGMYQPLKSMNFDDPAEWESTLWSYQEAVNTLKARGFVGEISALPNVVEQDLLQRLTRATPGETLNLLSTMQRSLNPSTYQSTLSKLYSNGAGRAAATAGAVAVYNPVAAASILRGDMLLKENPNFGPRKTEENTDKVDDMLPPEALGPALEGARQQLLDSAISLYADLSHQAGDISGDFNSRRMRQAIADVTGGLVEMNGHRLIAPVYGMTQRDFDKRLKEITDQDLIGAVDAAGRPITARDLLNQGRLRSVADGRYLLEFGRPETPMYVLRQPSPGNYSREDAFMLDLRE